MLKSITILLSFLILLVSAKDVISYGFFFLNQDYIANNICENRFDDFAMCSGKCFLAESISNNHTQDEQGELPPPQQDRSHYVKTDIFRLHLVPSSRLLQLEGSYYKKLIYTYRHINEVFHPPA